LVAHIAKNKLNHNHFNLIATLFAGIATHLKEK